jgi:TatD DNase family protein
MILVDTHTHIYYEEDKDELDHQMQRCLENQITKLFLPNVDSKSILLVMNTCKKYPENCFPMLGLHPCDVKENYEEELALIHQEIPNQKIYAIGEIGIDLYWDKTLLKQQQIAFETQINWAKELNLPIAIHCRDAFDEVFEVLKKCNDDKLRGIFHCFTGNLAQAQHAIDLGFYLGIGGVVTYKKSGLDQVVAQIDLKNIVLETDAPYLSPVPKRGKPNESSYLIHIANKIAEIKGITIEEVAATTTANSIDIFGI